MTAINSNRAIRGPVTAVPVVAGKGVRLVADTENNRWVVEADETVLWENNRAWIGTDTSLGTNSGTLSETLSNFERIRVYFARKNDGTLPSDNIAELDSTQIANFGGIYFSGSCIQSGSSNWFFCHTFLSVSGLTFTETLGGQWSQANGTINKTQIFLHPYKIVGIHRIASN